MLCYSILYKDWDQILLFHTVFSSDSKCVVQITGWQLRKLVYLLSVKEMKHNDFCIIIISRHIGSLCQVKKFCRMFDWL